MDHYFQQATGEWLHDVFTNVGGVSLDDHRASVAVRHGIMVDDVLGVVVTDGVDPRSGSLVTAPVPPPPTPDPDLTELQRLRNDNTVPEYVRVIARRLLAR
jgi:hypothetical protein